MPHGLHVVVGLGITGYSCVRYLVGQGIPVAVVDTRLEPPRLQELKQNFPQLQVVLGCLDETLLAQAHTIVLSPGVALHEPAIAKQVAQGVLVVGDIELFASAAKAPIVAITGSNAKSTVTTLVGKMAKEAGLNVKVGGNLGYPALDLLSEKASIYVLELSSFQLETTRSLQAQVATVLNLTPDHMDRYANFEEYKKAKLGIYHNCQVAVCNRDDINTECGDNYKQRRFYFTLQEPVQNEFGLVQKNNEFYLAFEDEILLPVSALPIRGRHYQANALAALAIGHGLGLPMKKMLQVLRDFKGLDHRCQLVRELNSVSWYNDSKGTNVGATLAAIEGLGSEIKGKIILIAGGVGKNADFSSLRLAVSQYVRTAILIGEAAPVLATAWHNACEIVHAISMEDAVNYAEQKAHPSDCVLLSPACASFDMFRNYEHRGEIFAQLVQGLAP